MSPFFLILSHQFINAGRHSTGLSNLHRFVLKTGRRPQFHIGRKTDYQVKYKSLSQSSLRCEEIFYRVKLSPQSICHVL